jgi:hypothetical protein
MLDTASTIVSMGTVIKQSGKLGHSPKMKEVFWYMTPFSLLVLVFCRNILSFSVYTLRTFRCRQKVPPKR